MSYIPADFDAKIAELSSRILDDIPKYAVSSVGDRNRMLRNMITGVAGLVGAKSYAFVEIRWSMADERPEEIEEGGFICPGELIGLVREGKDLNTYWVLVFDTDYSEGNQNVIHTIPVSKIMGLPKIWAFGAEAYCACEDDLPNLIKKANEIPLGMDDQIDNYVQRQMRELKNYYEQKGINDEITPAVLWKEIHAVGFPILGQYDGREIVLGCVTLQGMEYWDGVHSLPDNLMRQVQRVVNMASVPIINGTIAFREKQTSKRLSTTLNKLAATLEELEKAKAEIEKEKDRMQFELESARSVQTFLLPREAPDVQGFSVNGFCRPASEVGGDFFQYYKTSGDSLTVVIGDVSGKGLKAAMLVSLILGALQSLMKEDPRPAEILGHLNDIVHHEVGGKGFATCLICRMDPGGGSFEFSNAGHIPPYIFENGKSSWREWEGGPPPGFPLGLVPGFAYDTLAVEMKKGDAMLLMTDGVIEAMDGKRAIYGFDGLTEFLLKQTASVPSIADQLLQSVLGFEGGEPQADDITIMSIIKEI